MTKLIHPHGRRKIFWDCVVTFFSIYTIIEVPLRISGGRSPEAGGIVFEILVTLVFVTDIVVRFHTALHLRGRLYHRKYLVRRHYLGTYFWLDVAAALPLSLLPMIPGLGPLIGILRMNRLLRVIRVVHFSHELQRRVPMAIGLFRMIILVLWVALLTHWAACGWLAVSGSKDYLEAFYWTVTTMTGVGYGDITPDGSVQRLYAMAIMILGVGVYGFIIGNIAVLLSRLNIERIEHDERMERIDGFLSRKNAPHDLRNRIRDYGHYVLERGLTADEGEVIEGLPPSLVNEVLLCLNKKFVERVPLFKDADESLVNEIVLLLKPVVYTPGDIILKCGGIEKEMYFISQGSCRIEGPGGEKLAKLGPGKFFGEMALLMDQPRTATIRAVTYCQLYILSRDCFDGVLHRFPEFDASLRRIAQQRMAEFDRPSD